ncbi:MAG: hypothetical protein IJR99_15325 [Kiritimatiellae bacterium]|nr:hypothetical protein [Kiritimatiellia bacterium]
MKGGFLMVQGGVFAICFALFAGVASADGLTAYSYVQKDLKASYDGIDNAGTGTHDPTARVWKDLTGNCPDGTLADSVGWTENAWTNQTQCKPVMVSAPGLSAITGRRTFTMEFCVVPTRGNERESFFSQYNAGHAFAIEHNSSSNPKEGKIRLFGLKAQPTNSDYDWLSPVKVVADEWVSASVTVTPSRQVVWKNGAPGATNTVSIAELHNNCDSFIGGEPSRASQGFFGSYHAFRLYNRVLTDDEIAVNAAVDAIRFHGASAGDFTLSGGYSFDAEGELLVELTATAGEGGKVCVGTAGDAAATVTASANQLGTTSATFTAIPDEGYEFVSWQLADGATVTAGELAAATISVAAKWPLVAVTATFRQSGQLTAYSYVQKGLVACWDGIDNAGTGEHDPTIRVWKDLTGNGYNGTLGAAVTWAANGWQNEENEKPISLGYTLSGVTATREFTVEFTATPSRAPCREIFFGQFKYPSSGGLDTMNLERKADGKLRCYYNNGEVDFASAGTISANETASFTVTTTPSKQTVWKNGVKDLEQTAKTISKLAPGVPTYIGAEDDDSSSRMGYNFHGTYHACRLYDRVLTDAEIAVNNAVDAIRYRGASVGDFTLSGGYSFDAAGNLYIDLNAAAGTGGKVRARDAAPAAAVSSAINQDGGGYAVFTAVPDDGYEFDGWAVENGATLVGGTSKEDATINVSARWPLTVTAVFRPAHGAFATTANADYVKDGLLVWYDGVDNAGVGQHSDSAASWADLSGNGNHGVAVSEHLGWTDNACTNDSNGTASNAGLFQLGKVVDETIAARTFTLELAIRPHFMKERKVFFGSYNGAAGMNLEETAAGMFRVYFNNKPNIVTTVPLVKDEESIFSVVSTATNCCVYKNGVLVYRHDEDIDPTGMLDDLLATSTYYLGGEKERDGFTYRGAIHAFRLYGRALSSTEVLQNALLDQQRLFTHSTRWTAASSGGSWTDALNWSAGMPNVLTPASLVRAGGLQATLAQDAPETATLTLGGGSDSARLLLNNGATLPLTDSSLAVGAGGELAVETGGRLSFDVTGANPNPRLTVADGGRLSVNGGTVTLKNSPVSIEMFGSEGRTGTLAIASGRLEAMVTSGGQHGVTVRSGGRLEMSGGCLMLSRPKYYTEGSGQLLDGGEIELSGSATLVAERTGIRLGPGRFRMSGASRIVLSGENPETLSQFRLRGAKGEETVMTVEDSASFARNDGKRVNFYIGDNIADSRTILNWNSSSKLDVLGTVAVGFQKGYGELNICKGQISSGHEGLRVAQGSSDNNANAGCFPTGVVNITGGSLRNANGNNISSTFHGLIIGAGSCVKLSNPGFYRGTVNLYNGAVTNSSEYFGIGIGYAEGDLNQYAGEVIHSGNQNEFVIGAWGGKGTMIMEGGRAWSKSAVYIGGATTNNLYYKRWSLYTKCPVDNHCATGLLRVANGNFGTPNSIWVSQDGQGTLEIGPHGSVDANNVILTNTTAALTDGPDLAAKLAFTIDESGAGSLTVTNALTIGAGVTLDVDATGLNGRGGNFPLIRYAESEGEFDSITVRGGGTVKKLTVGGISGYWYQYSPGTILSIR